MNTKATIGDLISELEEVRDLLTVDDNVLEPIADLKEPVDTLKANNTLEDTKGNTLELVEQVLDYTEQEIRNINQVMIRVHEIDELRSKGQKIYATEPYTVFILTYTKELTDRERKYFEKIFIEFSLIGAKEKINELLIVRLQSGLDYINLKIHIQTIIKYEPDFDFSTFNSKKLNNFVSEIKKNT